MQIIYSCQEFKKLRNQLNTSIGFVPTMGNLHEGHASLLLKSKQENELTALSIFINPTQFNNSEDLKSYPRTLEEDKKIAESLSVDYLFLPTASDIYPDNYRYKMTESITSTVLEGKCRPSHFEGTLTIVMKFLLIIRPTRAYFGEKDYQQYLLVKNMTQAFFLETDIIGCPTIRNENGLPLSSRNNRLTSEQLEKAQLFPQLFHTQLTPEEITSNLISAGFEVEYVEDYNSRRFAAVKLDGIRLIDNISLEAL